MDTTCNFPSSEQTRNWLVISIKHSRLRVDLETAHCVMEDWGHDGDMKEVIKFPLSLEKRLPKSIVLSTDTLIIFLDSFLEDSRRKSELFSKGFTAIKTLHESTTHVMLAVPFNFFRSTTVKYQTDRILRNKVSPSTKECLIRNVIDLFILPDLSRHII